MARQIIYVFNSDFSTQKVETDSHDAVNIPASGVHHFQNGKSWFVTRVENCQMVSGFPEPIRTVRIFLTDLV
jgi:hypothetical protein